MDKVKNIQPKIAIDKILLKDNLQKLIHIPKVNDSEIDFENNNIHFYYTANSYQKYQNVEYQYRMEGYDHFGVLGQTELMFHIQIYPVDLTSFCSFQNWRPSLRANSF